MKPIQKPDNLSENAFKILLAAYNAYETQDTKYFDTCNITEYPREELETYLNELHENRYFFWEDRNEPDEYLYILPNALFLKSINP